MIQEKVSVSNTASYAIDPLNPEAIRAMVETPGPCVTILLPPYRPGAQAQSMAAVLRTKLQETARLLSVGKISNAAAKDLLDPLEQLTRDENFLAGSHWGRAIYASPGNLRQFELIGPINEALTVGERFHVRPLLAELHLPAEFYLLKLSKKDVALLRCTHFRAEPVPLPKGVPETLEAAMEFEQPDHDLENRSVAGASAGSMRRVRFGTGSGRETQQTHLSDFYKAVDRGVVELLNNGKVPLVLAGVDEDTAIYRMVNTYTNLLSRNVPSAAAGTVPLKDESIEQAYWIVRSEVAEKAASRLAEWRERATPARFSVHLEEILNASLDGRVDRIFIDESARRVGVFARANEHGHSTWGEEDLLNVAAVETIRHRGLAFALPNSKMPDGTAIAAVFRY